jgi:predicted metal-dependent hydrolase
MKNSRTINIDGIGSILLVHSTRAKRTTINVKPNKDVKVAIPMQVSFEAALEFVNRNERWIRKALAKIQQQESHQKDLAELYSSIDKIKAEKTLISRLNVLAKKHRFAYSKVSIRNQKTRWGSCSHKNTISLNMKLVALPKDLIDYVILHELVHTRIHSHSWRFWAELDKYVGNGKGKVMASRLREYGGSLL